MYINVYIHELRHQYGPLGFDTCPTQDSESGQKHRGLQAGEHPESSGVVDSGMDLALICTKFPPDSDHICFSVRC